MPSSQPAYPRYRLLIGKPSRPTTRSCPVQVTELAEQPQSQRCRSMNTRTGAMPQVAQRTREAMLVEQTHAIRHRSQPSVVHCHSCCHARGNLRRQGTTRTQLGYFGSFAFSSWLNLTEVLCFYVFLSSFCLFTDNSCFICPSLLDSCLQKFFFGEVTEEEVNY